MQINAISSTSAVAANSPATSTGPAASAANAFGANEFMQILLAQLTHQDPLEPMNNAEMMSQFSQLNSLQELRDIHTALETISVSNQTTYLASLIGRTVKFSRPDGEAAEGVVDGVVTETDGPQLLIGDETVDLTHVLEIKGEVR
jgi:flagellar basal-body rod modification protein FlgD